METQAHMHIFTNTKQLTENAYCGRQEQTSSWPTSITILKTRLNEVHLFSRLLTSFRSSGRFF